MTTGDQLLPVCFSPSRSPKSKCVGASCSLVYFGGGHFGKIAVESHDSDVFNKVLKHSSGSRGGPALTWKG